ARHAPTVLTPHAGELGRLLELDSAEIERERLRHVRTAAARAGAVVVLKGDDTLIADADGSVAVSPGGSPGLATAGTGDVLTGVIAALLAQQLAPFAAAAAGVWLHAAAGREAARRLGAAEGVIASDVIAALPAARAGARPDAGGGVRARRGRAGGRARRTPRWGEGRRATCGSSRARAAGARTSSSPPAWDAWARVTPPRPRARWRRRARLPPCSRSAR